jgi:plastocyanin
MRQWFTACVLLILFSVSIISSFTVISEEVQNATLSEEVVISVDSTNLRFSPSEVTITEGDTVRFFWQGQLLAHNAVEINEVFDSGDPERDVDYSFKFEIGMNGTYDFVCEPHESANMVGKIIVNPLIIMEEEDVEKENKSLPGFSTILLATSWIVAGMFDRRGVNGSF